MKFLHWFRDTSSHIMTGGKFEGSGERRNKFLKYSRSRLVSELRSKVAMGDLVRERVGEYLDVPESALTTEQLNELKELLWFAEKYYKRS